MAEILDGPDAGAALAVGCGGRWGTANTVANQLLAGMDEPILTDPDAGALLLADLWEIVEDVGYANPNTAST